MFIIGALAAIIASLLVSFAAEYYTQLTSPFQSIQNTKASATDLPSVKFVELCAGLSTANEQGRLMATANCLGRIRGYTDSHQQTIRMLQQTYAISKDTQLWCVPKSITDKELLTVILDWADANPSEFNSIVTAYNGTAAAMGVLAVALHAAYPCTK